MSPSHSKMVKNFITDAEMTEFLPFIAKVDMCLVTWHSAYAYWATSNKFWAFLENGLFELPPNLTNLEFTEKFEM
jgi:hypothetical protein